MGREEELQLLEFLKRYDWEYLKSGQATNDTAPDTSKMSIIDAKDYIPPDTILNKFKTLESRRPLVLDIDTSLWTEIVSDVNIAAIDGSTTRVYGEDVRFIFTRSGFIIWSSKKNVNERVKDRKRLPLDKKGQFQPLVRQLLLDKKMAITSSQEDLLPVGDLNTVTSRVQTEALKEVEMEALEYIMKTYSSSTLDWIVMDGPIHYPYHRFKVRMTNLLEKSLKKKIPIFAVTKRVQSQKLCKGLQDFQWYENDAAYFSRKLPQGSRTVMWLEKDPDLPPKLQRVFCFAKFPSMPFVVRLETIYGWYQELGEEYVTRLFADSMNNAGSLPHTQNEAHEWVVYSRFEKEDLAIFIQNKFSEKGTAFNRSYDDMMIW